MIEKLTKNARNIFKQNQEIEEIKRNNEQMLFFYTFFVPFLFVIIPLSIVFYDFQFVTDYDLIAEELGHLKYINYIYQGWEQNEIKIEQQKALWLILEQKSETFFTLFITSLLASLPCSIYSVAVMVKKREPFIYKKIVSIPFTIFIFIFLIMLYVLFSEKAIAGMLADQSALMSFFITILLISSLLLLTYTLTTMITEGFSFKKIIGRKQLKSSESNLSVMEENLNREIVKISKDNSQVSQLLNDLEKGSFDSDEEDLVTKILTVRAITEKKEKAYREKAENFRKEINIKIEKIEKKPVTV